MAFKFFVGRTCNSAYTFNARDEVILERPVHCDRKEGHEGAHEGEAVYVTGKKEMVYW